MKRLRNWQLTICSAALLLLVAAVLAPASRASTAAEPAGGRPALDGGKVYAWNCGSCHSERYPRERTDAEWDVIMTHMRVRANLTAAQTEAVLRYLRENNQ